MAPAFQFYVIPPRSPEHSVAPYVTSSTHQPITESDSESESTPLPDTQQDGAHEKMRGLAFAPVPFDSCGMRSFPDGLPIAVPLALTARAAVAVTGRIRQGGALTRAVSGAAGHAAVLQGWT